MAIRWLKDIGIIKRVLAEAETSARLVAIRSLELMLSAEALKVLEESHANAISFEKFFIEKAIDNIKKFQESGVMPVEIQKSIDKQEKLSKDSVKFKGFAVESDYSQEPVEIGDLSSVLSSHKSQESEKISEDSFNHDSYDENDSTPPEALDFVDSSTTLSKSNDSEITIEQSLNNPVLDNSSQVIENLPSQDLSYDEESLEEISSSVPSDSSETSSISNVLDGTEDSLSEVENIDDLLPVNTQSESLDSYEEDSSYDDLLPNLDPSQDGSAEAYDDLLPPLNTIESNKDDLDSFEDLLPPLDSNNSDKIDNFDDLLPSSTNSSLISPEDDYKDLLPPDNSDGLSELPVDNINYDDLLPPLDAVGAVESSDYDDLLPPLNVNSSEYDDLLPPVSSNVITDDLLPPLKINTEDTEELNANYDDLLPPLK